MTKKHYAPGPSELYPQDSLKVGLNQATGPYPECISAETGESFKKLFDIQLVYQPDHRAMLAALRVVLGLPRVPSPLRKPAFEPVPEA